MKFERAKLVKVLDGYHMPVDIQLWLESEWSVYVDKELSQEEAYGVLQSFLEEQDIACEYYLFDDTLYVIETKESLDPYGFVEATNTYEGIEVQALYYNGGGDFRECIVEGLKKLEGEL